MTPTSLARWSMVALLVGGCGGAAARVAEVPGLAPLPSSPVARYLPLSDGTQWAYDVEDGDGNRGMFVTRAKRLTGPRFSLASSGSAHTVEVRGDGIVSEETDSYVLKAPLTVGSTWPGPKGTTIRVSALDRAVDVAGGHFVGCLVTEEQVGTSERPERRVTTTYCPDVGIAEVVAEAWSGQRRQRERATLRSFGQPVDLGAPPR